MEFKICQIKPDSHFDLKKKKFTKSDFSNKNRFPFSILKNTTWKQIFNPISNVLLCSRAYRDQIISKYTPCKLIAICKSSHINSKNNRAHESSKYISKRFAFLPQIQNHAQTKKKGCSDNFQVHQLEVTLSKQECSDWCPVRQLLLHNLNRALPLHVNHLKLHYLPHCIANPECIIMPSHFLE